MAKYTAQQLREHAEWQEKLNGQNYIVADMLRQAADVMERDDREKKYEYAELYDGGHISPFHHCTYCDAQGDDVDGRAIVRREVGKWEEVK